MKHGLVFMLVGLLALGAAPSFGKDARQDLSATLVPDAVPFALDEEPAAGGPLRDPAGDDWIVYDDGSGPFYYAAPRLYARVIFTPNTEFQLQAISVCPGNWNNSNAPFNVYVFRENQQNHNLVGNPIFTARLNSLPEWQQDFAANWQLFEFDEEEYDTFAVDESFSVIYGLCPGGDQNQQGTGFWPIVDGATAVQRSYLAQVAAGAAPPANHAQSWQNNRLNNDLLIRANGTYLADFTDVGVLEVFNGDPDEPLTGAYLMYPNTEQTIKAQLVNVGADVDVMTVNFTAADLEGNAIWSYDQVVENFSGGDTLVVACEEAWSSETPGRYRIYVTTQAQDDSNSDNDQASLDQIVFDPLNDADAWIGYVDNDFESSTSGEPGQIGWAAMFSHPGNEDLLWLTSYRCMVEPADANEYEVVFLVAKIDLEARQLTTLLTDTLYTDNTGDIQWIERNLEREEYVTFAQNEAVMATYISAAGVRISVDGTPPIAGVNNHMPSSMMITFDGGNGYSGAGSGDYPVEIKLGVSSDPLEGAILRIEPDTLDFGEVSAGRDHSIEAMFISRGSDTIRVTNIQIPPSARNFVRLSQAQFAVASFETTYVTVTFRANVDTTIATQLLVSSNWLDHRQFFWRLTASATLSINEHVRPGLPGEYALNQNYPNPFNPTTSIGFALVKSGEVSFGVYDMNGRLVSELTNGRLEAGYHSFDFDASDLPAGIYTYRLSAGEFSSAKKMVLMK